MRYIYKGVDISDLPQEMDRRAVDQIVKLRQAKRYLRDHGINRPKVRIGALYTPPMTWQRPFTEEETKLQEALLAWKQTS